MSNIFVYEPAGEVSGQGIYHRSVNTPDYDAETNKLVNPDVSALSAVPEKYWKESSSSVVEMTAGEKTTVDGPYVSRKTVCVLGQSDIDGKTLATVDIEAAHAIASSMLMRVRFVAQDIDTLTSVPTVSIGTNATDYDNILAATALSDLAVTGDWQLVQLSTGAVISADTMIKCKVTVAAVATTFLLKIFLGVEED